jgi:hypothetical protein
MADPQHGGQHMEPSEDKMVQLGDHVETLDVY